MTDPKYIYVLSFSSGRNAGLALVIAYSEREAKSILINSGKKNGCGNYVIMNTRSLGETCSPEYGLIYESFASALVAYDALVSVLDKIKGEKGDPGPQGPQGPAGPQGGIVWPEMYVDDDLWIHVVEPESQLSDRLYFENGWLRIIQ